MSSNRRESTNIRPVGEEPPYLSAGTEVSAKYRGAFCEASIKSVKKMVKCKVTFDNGGGSSTVADDCIIGPLKVGADVAVKLPDSQNMTGTLVKITDSSAYTVVFDDGDERTLKRTSLCIKGEKHFNESETLDHLPLTDPENFGTPVVQKGKKPRKGRKPSLSTDDSKEADEIPARKKLLRNEENVDKVVMIEVTEKKKTFSLPALHVSSVASHYGDLKSPENILVRSFKDGKYIEVHPKDVKEFSKQNTATSSFPKGENVPLKLAVEHAVKYLETKQIPSDWNVESNAGNMQANSTGHSSSGEEAEAEDKKERDEFMACLTKFMEEKETPLLRSPVLGHRDLDLYKLFTIVSKMGGMDKITSWQSVYLKMDIPVMTTTAAYHIKNAYKRYLFEYEQQQREKEGKKSQPESKKCGKNDKFSKKQTVTPAASATAKQKEEAQSKSDSEKELPLSENKLPNHGKPSRGKRATSKSKSEVAKTRTDRTKSLKSPNSPKLSPKSPCSPMSLGSVSASGSAGCPSPLGNLSESRESRAKAGDAAGCESSSEVSKETDVVNDAKGDVSKEDKTKETSKSTVDVDGITLGDATKKESKEKTGRRNGKEAEDDVESKIEGVEGNDEAEVKGENIKKEDVKEEKENGGVEMEEDVEMQEDVNRGEDVETKEDVKMEKDVKMEEDIKMEEEIKTEEEIKMEEDGGIESEDPVDVVNSPAGLSNSTDSDEEDGKRAEKSSDENGGKSEAAGRTGGKQATGNDGNLEYNSNDRITVRYGRGRNATVYHAKITSVDPDADEGLCYLVHYAGWNARHDEWISSERIIGKGQMQTRTRTCKESLRNKKPTPKPTAKPVPKPMAKKNGRNGSVEKQITKSIVTKVQTRTPSPTANGAPSNGRASKKISMDSLDLADVKCQPRVTRHNSLPTPVNSPDCERAGEKSQDPKEDGGKEDSISPRASPVACRTSPRSQVEKNSESATENNEETVNMEVGGCPSAAEVKLEDTATSKPLESASDTVDFNGEIDSKATLKRPHDGEDAGSPSSKISKEDDVASEVVFDEKEDPFPAKEPNDPVSPEVQAAVDDANTPDLTCSEQLSTNCVSPDPYTNEYSGNDVFFANGIGGVENDAESKEKDSSSSVDEAKSDEAKSEKLTNRKAPKGRRERKTRAPSSQSSFEGSECPNGSSRETFLTHISSPTRPPKYNFTEDLDELLKKEESSERIRLLQEKIKDIRKIYGELKSEVANIDRKKKRRQKRKREEELSTEEGNTRSPSRSSPLSATNGNAVSASNSLAPVECR